MSDLEYDLNQDDDYVDGSDPCQTCGGDGFEMCEDWDCNERDCSGTIHTCPNCKGSGAAEDQWYW